MQDTILAPFERSGRAVWAVALREFRKRYGARKLGLFWAFAEPMGYVIVFSLILSAVRQSSSPIGGSIAPFLTEGLFAFMLFSATEGFISGALTGNQALLSFPRIKPMSLYVGRLITEFATLIVVFSLLYGSYIVAGIAEFPHEPARLILPTLLATTLGFSVGVINGTLGILSPAWESIYSTFSRINFIISGMFFTAESMPPQIKAILYYTPFIHFTEWIRSAFHDNYESRFYDPVYITWFVAIMLLLALIIERVFRRRVIAKL